VILSKYSSRSKKETANVFKCSKVLSLKDKVAEYLKLFGKRPEHLQDLISEGLLAELPADPYGGIFFITKDGHVYTTSKLVRAKKTSDN